MYDINASRMADYIDVEVFFTSPEFRRTNHMIFGHVMIMLMTKR